MDNLNQSRFCKEIKVDRVTISCARDHCGTLKIEKKIAKRLKIPFNALFDDVTPTKENSGSTLNK